ncbi:MAG: hypothetical protein C0518_06305 [Opitutus sp.]|nr:hypothetical protein [Opitutus sp.]
MHRSVEREEALFNAALALPPSGRLAFLQREAAGDPGLVARVERLLEFLPQTDGFLEATAGDAIAVALGRPSPAQAAEVENLVGEQVGAFTVLARLGEGGVGVVYRAEQAEPLRREVALKVIKPGMDTREVLARFDAERQALALMDHPGIARVFEAGATRQGRPYFAMELVAGVPLTRYCDEHTLPLAARLELFKQVCDAVQHAHQKGVIHRDLKPSNILVATVDGAPRPKIIDFGIAKAVVGRARASPAVTAVTQLVGTPGYMSPEQVAGDADLDTRSDIYSLGVVLHELLVGRTPHETSTVGSVDELRRRIRDVEATRPSAAFARLSAEDRATIAAGRAVSATRLAAELRGDLDWMVLRCLEKDRARRYATANGLASDLVRHQRSEPVMAAAPSRIYRFKKSLQRNRAAYASGALVFAALIAAAAVSRTQAVRATAAERLAAQRATAEAAARSRAEQAERVAANEAAASRALSDFLRQDLLAQASPDNQRDRDLKLRTVLDRAAGRIEGRFAQQPLVEATIRETLAATYIALGEFAAAEQHLAAARELHRREGGDDSEGALRAAGQLVQAWRLQSKLAAASELATDTLARLERKFGPEHALSVQVRNALQAVLLGQGKFAVAEPLLRQSLDVSRRTLGPENNGTLMVMSNLALALTELGRLPEAIALSEETIAIKTRVLGAEHPQTLPTLINLAAIYCQAGRMAEAIALGKKVLAVRERVLGAEHPQTLSASDILANIHVRAGNSEEAGALFDRTLPLERRILGEDHAATLAASVARADIFLAQDLPAAAEPLAAGALERLRARFGPEHVQTLDALLVFARVRTAQQRWTDAEELFARAQAIAARTLGPETPRPAAIRFFLGRLRLAQGRAAEALPLLRATVEHRRRAVGDSHPETLAAQLAVGEALLRLEERAEAEATLLACHAGLTRAAAAAPENIALPRSAEQARRLLTELYTAANRPDEAARWAR